MEHSDNLTTSSVEDMYLAKMQDPHPAASSNSVEQKLNVLYHQLFRPRYGLKYLFRMGVWIEL